jgi:hypothetical protein
MNGQVQGCPPPFQQRIKEGQMDSVKEVKPSCSEDVLGGARLMKIVRKHATHKVGCVKLLNSRYSQTGN